MLKNLKSFKKGQHLQYQLLMYVYVHGWIYVCLYVRYIAKLPSNITCKPTHTRILSAIAHKKEAWLQAG